MAGEGRRLFGDTVQLTGARGAPLGLEVLILQKLLATGLGGTILLLVCVAVTALWPGPRPQGPQATVDEPAYPTPAACQAPMAPHRAWPIRRPGSRVNRPAHTAPESTRRSPRPGIAARFSCLFTSMIANRINTFTAPT